MFIANKGRKKKSIWSRELKLSGGRSEIENREQKKKTPSSEKDLGS